MILCLVEAYVVVPVVVQVSDHPNVPHEGLVVLDGLHGMVELPAVAAVVLETRQVPVKEIHCSVIRSNTTSGPTCRSKVPASGDSCCRERPPSRDPPGPSW